MATQTHSPFETLARVIEHLDDDGRTVRRTEAAGGGGGSLRATVDVSVDATAGPAGLEPAEAAVDGGLSVTFRAPSFPDPAESLPAGYPEASVAPTGVELDGDAVVVTLEVTIGGDDPDAGADAEYDGASAPEAAGPADAATFGASDGADGRDAAAGGTAAGAGDPDPDDEGSGAEAASALAAVRDESVPPYDDTPYLRRLYETCETFDEMSERIEMDVSAETVRRYMIEADVHSPDSYETADGGRGSGGESDPGTADRAAGADAADRTGRTPDADADAAGGEPANAGPNSDPDVTASLPDEQLVADGIGLPEELTLRDVVDAVVDARTVHEVQREVGLGYDRTRQLLTQLNVLDLVVGRVSGESDRAVTVDVVADRIRQCTPDAA